MFEILKRDGLARICEFATPHGVLETPCLLPVVSPKLLTIPPEELYRDFGVRAVITNSYIIRGDDGLRKRALDEEIHALLGFPGTIMTDSGTFQSHVYGEVEVGNREIVEFQRDIGADIGTVLDIFTEPAWGKARAAEAVDETLSRTREAAEIKGRMMLAGVVQGSLFPDLRERCAREASVIQADIHPIGGVVPLMENYRFSDLVEVIIASKKGLVPSRPVHLFGAGHPMVFALAALLGCDMFDSASYAKFARDDRLMFPEGTFHLQDMKRMICDCPACREQGLQELRKMDGEARAKTIARHNLHESLLEIERVKKAIMEGSIWELVEQRCRSHPALLNGLRRLAAHKDFLEAFEPLSRDTALFYTGPESLNRPAMHRYERRFFSRYVQPDTQILLGFEDGKKPYNRTFAKEMAEVSALADAHFLVMSPFGPVPIELDEIYPISQSIFPETRDRETEERTRRLMEEMSHRQTYGMCVIWEGDETLEMLSTIARGRSSFDVDMARVEAVADYQFGKGAAALLLEGEVELVKSKTTQRIRNVLVDGEHVLSMRASDGFFTLRPAGARRILKGFASPRMRVVVNRESAEFNREGKNVFCGFVLECDEEIGPMDEVLVVDEDDALAAIGRTLLTRNEMLSFMKGLAVKVREGVPR